MSKKTFDWKQASQDWPEIVPLRHIDELPNFPWKQNTIRGLCSDKNGIPLFQNIKRRIGPRLVYFERDELAAAVQEFQDGKL